MNGTHLWMVAIAAGLSFSQVGCSGLYLHDKGRSDAAKNAKVSFAEFIRKSPDRYDAMVKNLQRIAIEEDALLADLAANTDIARVTLSPNATLGELAAEAQATQVTLVTFNAALRESILNKLKADEDRAAAIKTTADAVAVAQKNVEAAKSQVTRWNAAEAVLLKAIESLPEARSAGNGQGLADALLAGATALGDKSVTYFDANGKEVTETVRKLANDAVTDAGSGLSISGRKAGLTRYLQAPGADLVIMNLALELAKVEQRRAKLAQQRAEALADLSREAFVATAVASQVLREGGGELEELRREYGPDTAIMTAIAQERARIVAARANAQESATRAVEAKASAVAAAQKPRIEKLSEKLVASRSVAANEQEGLAEIRQRLDAIRPSVKQEQDRLDAKAIEIDAMPPGDPKKDAAATHAQDVQAFALMKQAFEGRERLLADGEKNLDKAKRAIDAAQQQLDAEVAAGVQDLAQAREQAVKVQHEQVIDAERRAANSVAGLLGAVRKAAVARAMVIRIRSTFELQVARASHEDSIADSALNDDQWRAVIASGIEGLDQYYANGIRSEDVANFIRLGQAIATGVIADKVD